MYSGILFSLKKERHSAFMTTRMELDSIMLRKKNIQTHKNKCCMISFICRNLKIKIIEAERMVVTRSWVIWQKGLY
jgi:hypothetical protein